MKHIAIIGSGISGLTCAYLLSQKHKVTVFEKNSVIGGHTATVDVEVAGEKQAIDTGFIVFNDKTYPNFIQLLEQLNVQKQKTEMSFSVANLTSNLEYNGHNLDTLFAQRKNIFSLKFWGLIFDILHFNYRCVDTYENELYEDGLTLGQFLKQNRFKDFFSNHYILPMAAAIWSSSIKEIEDFPFKFFVQFFYHHGLLRISNRPQWYVIANGSRSYLAPLTQRFKEQIYVNQNITSIKRNNGKVQLVLTDETGNREQEFDEVVLACHSDQALELLATPTVAEQSVLGSIPYSKNSVILHTDESILPKAHSAWASWNYRLDENTERPAAVSYCMNILQQLTSRHTFCVTLNQKLAISSDKVLREFTYHHPKFQLQSIDAQKRRSEICGQNHTHFAGAYWYSGFHEDGVKSAIDVASRFDCYLND
ncbi:FAD-dependent oxidoreductase [Shewanella sp. 202IG2-18]|uniref:NAD(P)/FAD-dependent oxidoreductase n=1 Tax=Parashewanella hymeniacidonis TaxID=2807618 RepID=UPI00196132C7|nr:FAD-dependent oxidoreductase [Parashewanella hymeniacidonis]MBM7074356.1 FAD-dependent oxidoreductase [Parashewanella hymeniacidonis]